MKIPRMVTWLAVLVIAVGSASATGPAGVRRTVEASMLLTGIIDVDAQGQVTRFKLDDRALVPPELVRMVETAVPSWTFEPVLDHGKAVASSSNATLRLLARERDGQVFVQVADANFSAVRSEDLAKAMERGSKLTPPAYPLDALESGIKGIVYVVISIDAQGMVADAIAEQVNLTVVGSDQQMKKGRNLLARAALVAARKWTFDVGTLPAPGPGQPRLVRVPINFAFHGDVMAGKYEWSPYVPGPKQRAPWMGDGDTGNSDALVPGKIFIAGTGPRLLTDLAKG